MLLTIGYQNWAVDLKDVGAIYPFQGFEMPMTIAAVVFWIVWHIWQIRQENAEIRRQSASLNVERAKSAIERY